MPERLVEQRPETVVRAVVAVVRTARVHVTDVPVVTSEWESVRSDRSEVVEGTYLVMSAMGRIVRYF